MLSLEAGSGYVLLDQHVSSSFGNWPWISMRWKANIGPRRICCTVRNSCTRLVCLRRIASTKRPPLQGSAAAGRTHFSCWISWRPSPWTSTSSQWAPPSARARRAASGQWPSGYWLPAWRRMWSATAQPWVPVPRACSGNMLLASHVCFFLLALGYSTKGCHRLPKDQSHRIVPHCVCVFVCLFVCLGLVCPVLSCLPVSLSPCLSVSLSLCLCVCDWQFLVVNFLHVSFLEDEQYSQSLLLQFCSPVSRGGTTFFDAHHASNCSPLESKSKNRPS